jgi:2'-5' RNA ligase
MHLTLHFLGEVAERDVPALRDVLTAPIPRPPFEVELGRVGVFPPSGPVRVVWLGCSRGSEDLAALHRITAERLASVGCAVEARPFSPHLTLGRVRDRVPHDFRARVTAAAVPTVGPWTVSDITLYQSHLGPSGARYAVVTRTRLAS